MTNVSALLRGLVLLLLRPQATHHKYRLSCVHDDDSAVVRLMNDGDCRGSEAGRRNARRRWSLRLWTFVDCSCKDHLTSLNVLARIPFPPALFASLRFSVSAQTSSLCLLHLLHNNNMLQGSKLYMIAFPTTIYTISNSTSFRCPHGQAQPKPTANARPRWIDSGHESLCRTSIRSLTSTIPAGHSSSTSPCSFSAVHRQPPPLGEP